NEGYTPRHILGRQHERMKAGTKAGLETIDFSNVDHATTQTFSDNLNTFSGGIRNHYFKRVRMHRRRVGSALERNGEACLRGQIKWLPDLRIVCLEVHQTGNDRTVTAVSLKGAREGVVKCYFRPDRLAFEQPAHSTPDTHNTGRVGTRRPDHDRSDHIKNAASLSHKGSVMVRNMSHES